MESAPAPRPPAIVAFERLYLGSTLLYVIVSAVFWSQTRELMLAFQGAQGVAGMITGIMVVTLLITLGASLLLWWLVARQRSVVGKWLVVATEVIGVIGGLFALLRLIQGSTPNAAQSAMTLVVTALAVAAAAMLFRADARAWFGETVANEEVVP